LAISREGNFEMSCLELRDVAKKLDRDWVVAGVDLTLANSEIVALLGPSGCGKTTLLRLIAGLTRPDRGTIRFEGRDLSLIPAHRRGFRMMFQDFALFPHRTVARNVAFGLEVETRSAGEIDRRVDEMLALVGLSGYGERDVEALSGGERQRVALARSLAADPKLLMLDEPLGALDRALRQRLLRDLVEILRHIRVPTLFVTHDQQEAFGVADRIAVMETGRILQIDSPEVLYHAPRSAAVARFLGFTNLIPGEPSAPDAVETILGRFPVVAAQKLPAGPLTLLIRPEAATLTAASDAMDVLVIEGEVTAALFQGGTYEVAVTVRDETPLRFTLPSLPKPPTVGQPIRLRLDPRATVILPGIDRS
jgi:ABC-type Fe3+/spermidine/putrescine transport system ATPase subunit